MGAARRLGRRRVRQQFKQIDLVSIAAGSAALASTMVSFDLASRIAACRTLQHRPRSADCNVAAALGSLRGHRRDDVLALPRCFGADGSAPVCPYRVRMSAVGGTAENICSPRVFRLLTHKRHQTQDLVFKIAGKKIFLA
jgi:hypothetical protein